MNNKEPTEAISLKSTRRENETRRETVEDKCEKFKEFFDTRLAHDLKK